MHRGKLHIVVCSTAVAPEHRVENHTAVADIYTSRTTMTPTVVRHIGTDTIVSRDCSVVNRTTFGQIDTTALGRSGIIVDYASRRERRVVTNSTQWVLGRYMTNSQTATASCCTIGDMAMADLSVVLDTCATAITLNDTDTCRLACVDIAELHYTATVKIYTATAQGGVTLLNDTVPQLAIANQVRTTTIG